MCRVLSVSLVPGPVLGVQQGLSEHFLMELGGIICPRSQYCCLAKKGLGPRAFDSSSSKLSIKSCI